MLIKWNNKCVFSLENRPSIYCRWFACGVNFLASHSHEGTSINYVMQFSKIFTPPRPRISKIPFKIPCLERNPHLPLWRAIIYGHPLLYDPPMIQQQQEDVSLMKDCLHWQKIINLKMLFLLNPWFIICQVDFYLSFLEIHQQ